MDEVRAGKVALWVKMLATKPDHLSFLSGVCMVEGEN